MIDALAFPIQALAALSDLLLDRSVSAILVALVVAALLRYYLRCRHDATRLVWEPHPDGDGTRRRMLECCDCEKRWPIRTDRRAEAAHPRNEIRPPVLTTDAHHDEALAVASTKRATALAAHQQKIAARRAQPVATSKNDPVVARLVDRQKTGTHE